MAINTKEMFIKITSLDKVTDIDIYKILHNKIPNSYIEIHMVEKITYRDVKK